MRDFKINIPGFRTALLFVILLPINSSFAALFPQNLSGYFHLTGVNSSNGGDESTSLNQEYSVFWKKRLLPYIDAKAFMRYHNFGLDQSLGANVWREEYQPSGELTWSHPYFSTGVSITRQNSASNNGTTNLVRDNFSANFSTKRSKYPTIGGRYFWNKTYNNLDLNNRDTRDRQLQLSLDYFIRNNNLYYGFTAGESRNLVTDVRIDERRHIFRWNQYNSLLDKKLQINANYNFRFRSQSFEKPLTGAAYNEIPVFSALFGYDTSPGIDGLDTLSSLGDGNIVDPAQPEIDIGSGLIDRNIGVDLGYIQNIAALYIYTDRPSGSQLQWNVYLSSDNLSWTRLSELPSVSFNAGFSRYEIAFSDVNTRYIKAVNSGANDIVTVLVTEIIALEKAPGTEIIKKDQSVHAFDLAGTYKFTEKLQTSADLSYRNEPKGDFRNSKDQLYYTCSLRHLPREYLTHIVNFQSGFEHFKISGIKEKSRKLSYSIHARPLETLDFSFSVSGQSNYQNDLKTQNLANAILGASGKILKGLKVQGEIMFSRINRIDSGIRYDSRSYRTSATTALTQSLDLAGSFLYQSSKDNITFAPRKRRQLSLNSSYRLTGAILLRASIYVNNDNGLNNLIHDYNVNWNIGQRITVGGSANLIKNNTNARIERYGGHLNIRMSARTTVFANYSMQFYAPSDILNTSSLQIGLKSGF